MTFRGLATAALVLGVIVVVMGGWVRLSDAGLGCPDWPGCYGQLTWPNQAEDVAAANAQFPERPVEPHKAWREMVHRYAAGALGIVILAMAVVAWRRRREEGQPVAIPVLLVGLVTFQAILGMWTVTLKLKPVVVMAHLLGGLATISLILWCLLRAGRGNGGAGGIPGFRGMILAGLVVLSIQVALGGWTSANYAALSCPDFPQCQGQWWPETDFADGFVLWRGIGPNYEFGILDAPARNAIQMSHRVGALAATLLLGFLALRMVLAGGRPRALGVVLAALLAVQLALGVANVLLRLPLPVAVGHNAGAALLLLWLVYLYYRARPAAHR
jgi:cytochrome c oxidase assembly protein subunit 15